MKIEIFVTIYLLVTKLFNVILAFAIYDTFRTYFMYILICCVFGGIFFNFRSIE